MWSFFSWSWRSSHNLSMFLPKRRSSVYSLHPTDFILVVSFRQVQRRSKGTHTGRSPFRSSGFCAASVSPLGLCRVQLSNHSCALWSVGWFPLYWSYVFPLCHRRTVPGVQRSVHGEAMSRGHAVCRLRSQQETIPLPVSTGKAWRVLRCRVGWNDEDINSYSQSIFPVVNYTVLALPEDTSVCICTLLQNGPQLTSTLECTWVYCSCSLC